MICEERFKELDLDEFKKHTGQLGLIKLSESKDSQAKTRIFPIHV